MLGMVAMMAIVVWWNGGYDSRKVVILAMVVMAVMVVMEVMLVMGVMVVMVVMIVILVMVPVHGGMVKGWSW